MNCTATHPAGTLLRRMLPLACSLLVLIGCRSHDMGMPIPHVRATSSVLHLSVRTPRRVVLRSVEAEDPMLRIKTLHFAFYTEDGQLSTEVREVKVTSPEQLKDLTLALPEGAYKLVVVANATRPLLEHIAIGRPLSGISGYTAYLVDDLSTETEGALDVVQLNEQGAISVPASAFGATTPQLQVSLEPALARVLVYGEPQLPTGVQRGSAPVDYLVNGVARYTAPLRPLGMLRSGGQEVAGDGSNAADRYPSSRLYELWGNGTPTTLTEGLSYYTPEMILGKTDMTIPRAALLADEASFVTARASQAYYIRETTVPPTAYLVGSVPTVVLRFPYIPEGLSLQGNEGWCSFEGKCYAEHDLRQMIRTGKAADPRLRAAITAAGLSEAKLSAPFESHGISFHYRGYCFYTIPIRHFNDSEAPEKTSLGRYGLVRGNEYRIHLTRILRPGAAVPPDLAHDMHPLTEEKDLRTVVHVRPIINRSQEAHL